VGVGGRGWTWTSWKSWDGVEWIIHLDMEVVIMPLSKNQLKKAKEAIGDGSDWPKITSDPMVNHKVDQLVSDKTLPDWENLPEETKQQYEEEVKFLDLEEG